MTYSNYVNSSTKTTGANNNTYVNYANMYKDSSNSTSPYGFTTVTGAIGTPFSYTNYNNWQRPAPVAYAMTTLRSDFTPPATMSGNSVKNLRNDINNHIAVDHVASNGAGITSAQTPVFTQNSDANLASGAPASPGIFASLFNEMRTNVQSLWLTITGNAGTGWPTSKVIGDPISGTDYQTLFDKAQTLGAAQPETAITGTPPNTIPAPGTARATGYLNCAHWANTPGVNTYSAPYAAAKTETTGVSTYPAIGSEPATNR